MTSIIKYFISAIAAVTLISGCSAKIKSDDKKYKSQFEKATVDPIAPLALTISNGNNKVYNQFKVTQTFSDQYNVSFNFISETSIFYEFESEIREAQGCNPFDTTVSTTWIKRDNKDNIISMTPVIGYESFLAEAGFNYTMLVKLDKISKCTSISYGFVIKESGKSVLPNPTPTPAPTPGHSPLQPATGKADARVLICQNSSYIINVDFTSCPFTSSCSQEITVNYKVLSSGQSFSFKKFLSSSVSNGWYSYNVYDYNSRNGLFFYTTDFIKADADLELQGVNAYNIPCTLYK
jgi:hypothetical protein